jgi:EmrB/QacA subfamily drug resistance transporter
MTVTSTDVGTPDDPARPGSTSTSTSTSVAVAVAVVSAGVWMANIDLFIVNLALPDIRADFTGSSFADLSWVLTAYATVFAALLVPAGRWADRIGRRSGYLTGLGLFTVASALAAAAPDTSTLVVARVVQAAGAGLLVPTSLSLLLTVVPVQQRAKAIGSWAATAALAAAAGPVLGGLLVQVSWRWVFLVNVPVGVVTAVAARRLLPEGRAQQAPTSLDAVGALAIAAGVGMLALGLVRAEAAGWSSGEVLTSLIAAALLLGWVLRRSWTHPTPILDVALLRVRTFTAANLASLLFYAAFAAMLLFAVLWLTGVWQYSAVRAGLGIACGPLVVPVVARTVTPRMIHRCGAALTSALGCVSFAGGLLLWSTMLVPEPSYAAHMLPGLLLTGVGVGLAMPAQITAGAAVLPPHLFATGSAVLTMSRQIGAVAGTSVFLGAVSHGADAATLTTSLTPFVLVSMLAAVASGGLWTKLNARSSTSTADVAVAP